MLFFFKSLQREQFKNEYLEMFPLLCNFAAENNVSTIKTLIPTYSMYLQNRETEFPNLFF